MIKDKIDVIIPTFKAHGTILRCLASIACQTIIGDVSITIVNDCCPEGDYSEAIKAFSPVMDVREIKMNKNGGPGAARQYGIDSTDGEFFTCVDADDSLYSVAALETLRNEIQKDHSYKCCSGSFWHGGRRFNNVIPGIQAVWMFGKLFRRDFIQQYNIRFGPERANEDSGYNHTVRLLCDNPLEQWHEIDDTVYYYHDDNPNSITNIGNKQYWYDQSGCGATDSYIRCYEHVRKYKPFVSDLMRDIAGYIHYMYYQYVFILDRAPEFSIQLWEYCKKFYHRIYKPIESSITEDMFKDIHARTAPASFRTYGNMATVPKITMYEFMNKLHTEEYDPNLINEIQEEMKNDPGMATIMANRIACGVCPVEEAK